jgi:hypothetical protein
MERRALLSVLGGSAAALAGCTDRLPSGDGGDTGDDQPADSPGDSPTGTPTPGRNERRVPMGKSTVVDKQMLKIENPRVRPSVIRAFGAWQSLHTDGGQYLVVDVTTGGPVPDHRDEVALRGSVDGEALDGGPMLVTTAGGGAQFEPAEWERQPIAFGFPVAEHDRASVRWQVDGTTVRWPLGDSIRAALAAAPAFRIESLDARRVPGETGDGAVELALRVANDGDRDARFQLQVSFEAIHDASSIVELDVPAGGTASYRDVPPILEYQGVETVTLNFRARGAQRRRKLSVPQETAPPSN